MPYQCALIAVRDVKKSLAFYQKWFGMEVEVDLGFPMGGTIAARPVELGDVVARDEVLARLDPEDLEADLRAADAGIAVATAQRNSARDARDRARELVLRGVGGQSSARDLG